MGDVTARFKAYMPGMYTNDTVTLHINYESWRWSQGWSRGSSTLRRNKSRAINAITTGCIHQNCLDVIAKMDAGQELGNSIEQMGDFVTANFSGDARYRHAPLGQ